MTISSSSHGTSSLHGQALLRVISNNSTAIIEHRLSSSLISIGRDTSNDLVIEEDIVSGHHFQIEECNGLYYLIHPHPSRAETANGFTFQGKQYQGRDTFRHMLSGGDVFRIGDASGSDGSMVSIVFDDGRGDAVDAVPPGYDFALTKSLITIGRDSRNDVCLNHPTVSLHHADLEKDGHVYRIIDRSSTNRVLVNGTPVTTHYLNKDDVIQIGALKLTYTGTLLRCDTSRRVRIEAQQMYRVVKIRGKEKNGTRKKDKALLRDVSLVIPSSSFVALVGGSGAGKSTLMRALNGLTPAHGTIRYNGYDYYKSYAIFSTQLGYVPQDDIVHRELTVYDALYYGAKLRLPNDFNERQIRERIETVLEEVELLDKKDNLIDKLSGGQRKRVSIALELLADPGIFFLDEPTSGLDPGLDRKMMVLLRKLADRGKTIVLVTHATNNINVCDYVCFMGYGRLVYFGPPHLARQFFKKTDFADIYNELDEEQKCEDWRQKFRKHPDYQKYVAQPLNIPAQQKGNIAKKVRLKRAGRGQPFAQWWFLCKRYLELLKNDRGNLALLLLQAPVIAIIVFAFIWYGIGRGGFDINKVVQCPHTAQVFTKNGLPDVPNVYSPAASVDCEQLKKILETTPQGRVYAARRGGVQKALQDFIVPGPGDAPIILFIMAFAAIMCGCINSSREIVKEDAIYRRERAVNISILAYLFSKIAVLGVLCLLQSAALVFIVSLADAFPHGTMLPGGLEVYITIALTSLAGLMIGLALSAVVPNSDRAMSFLPLILLPQVVFSGTLFPLATAALQIIGMLWPVRWAMAALGSTVGIHSDKMFGSSEDGDKLFGNNYSYHGTLFSTYSQTNASWHLLYIWGALALTLVVLFVISFVALWWKDRRVYGYVRKRCLHCEQRLSRPHVQYCGACGASQY